MTGDAAFVGAFFRVIARDGWRRTTMAAAAQEAGLSLTEARGRFATSAAVLRRFGQLADQAALEGAVTDGPARDRLFDLLMRRFDALQAQRDGVLALLRAMPSDPATALVLACSTRNSMRWMLQAAGVPATGIFGELRINGLIAVWLWAARAWERDGSDDLTGTMAALDVALLRAEQAASWLNGSSPAPKTAPENAET